MVDDAATPADTNHIVYEWPASVPGFVPARVVADGGGRFYITGAHPDPDSPNTHLRDAADSEAAGGVPDLDAARQRLYATRAPTPEPHTDGRLSRLARRVVRLAGRPRDVASDTYTGPEYEFEPMREH